MLFKLTTFTTWHIDWAHGATGRRYTPTTAGSLLGYSGCIVRSMSAILGYTRSVAVDKSLITCRQGTYTIYNLCWNLTICYICWCSEYHRYCKKYTFHSRWRAEYIFPGDHDTTAPWVKWEKAGHLLKKRRKLHFGICCGAICESSIYLIVKCNVNFVTPHDVVVSDQRSFWNQRKVLLRNSSFMLMV